MMNTLRSGLVVALFSAVYCFPCHVYGTGESAGSDVFTEVSSCSELNSRADRDVCRRHLPVLKNLIREKSNQSSSTTCPAISRNAFLSTCTDTPPGSKAVRIRKISATTNRLGHEVFRTIHPTLFIFDAEQTSGNGQAAVYELPMTGRSRHFSIGFSSFQLPDNSAFVGNRIDILPEFVIKGHSWFHYVMSAPHNDSVYYLANIKVDSRNPLDTGKSFTAVATVPSVSPPRKPRYVPGGVLNLRGAGIFVADNIKVVLDPVDNQVAIKLVELGCTDHGDGRGTEESFVYRFMHSEFDLLQGIQKSTQYQNAALTVDCFQNKGQVQLTMKNTKTVISLPTETATPAPLKSSGVLFDMHLWHRENVLHLVDSTYNSIVDQFGNDLCAESANPSDLFLYMGGISGGRYCSDTKVIQGTFGLKGRDEAWGLTGVDQADSHRCSTELAKRYQLGFASVKAGSSARFDAACNSPMPISDSTTQSPHVTDTGAMAMSNTGRKRLKPGQIVSAGIGALVVNQAITHSWFYFSKHIRQASVRYTSQMLAATLGLGIPLVQLIEVVRDLRPYKRRCGLYTRPSRCVTCLKRE
ncbi:MULTISPECIES: hypothetical protein [unclassified Endozoicomonas]|uniref:hypothetical protein n=1 Tax=unclassified Endozoicomonas TaxID=2644528 RepID=UPI00214943B0|nr:MULTISPECIES: hypothetical protein [unclassified Endozoicomonas]